MTKEFTPNISPLKESLGSIQEANALLSKLPQHLDSTKAQLKGIIAKMPPDVRTSFIPLLREEVTSILNGQNKFSIRITRLMIPEGTLEGKLNQRFASSANDDQSEQAA